MFALDDVNERDSRGRKTVAGFFEKHNIFYGIILLI